MVRMVAGGMDDRTTGPRGCLEFAWITFKIAAYAMRHPIDALCVFVALWALGRADGDDIV